MATNRPLTASLHTVTAVTRVAMLLLSTMFDKSPESLTAGALRVLGYQTEADAVTRARAFPNSGALSPLLAKCLDSVRRALAGGAK